MPELKNYTWDQEGSVATVTINRPEVYNALTREAKLELIKAIKRAEKDSELKVIILTGAGKAFCSGQDLNDRSISATDRPVDLGFTLETEWNPLVNALRESSKIIIGAINGVCAGAGLSVAMACDLVISHPDVRFVSGFSKLGLAPDAGSSHVFTRAMGPKSAMEFFLFNRQMSAGELKEYGLVNSLDDDPVAHAKEWAHKIGVMAPLSLKAIKQNIQWSQDNSWNDSLERERACQRHLGNSDDYREGLSAFFEKRPAQFKGQ